MFPSIHPSIHPSIYLSEQFSLLICQISIDRSIKTSIHLILHLSTNPSTLQLFHPANHPSIYSSPSYYQPSILLINQYFLLPKVGRQSPRSDCALCRLTPMCLPLTCLILFYGRTFLTFQVQHGIKLISYCLMNKYFDGCVQHYPKCLYFV